MLFGEFGNDWDKRGCCYEKIEKKNRFCDFRFFIGLGSISEKPVNIVQKLFHYLLVMNKVKKIL